MSTKPTSPEENEFRPDPKYYQKHPGGGIYGWKKYVLWIMLISFVIIAIVNIALTSWIIRELGMNRDGIRGVKFQEGNLAVSGKLEVDNSIYGTRLSGFAQRNLIVRSEAELIVEGSVIQVNALGNTQFSTASQNGKFSILSSANANLFSVDAETLSVNVPAAFGSSVRLPNFSSLGAMTQSAVGNVTVLGGDSHLVSVVQDALIASRRLKHAPRTATEVVFGNNRVKQQCACTYLDSSNSNRLTLVFYYVDFSASCDSIPIGNLNALCPQ